MKKLFIVFFILAIPLSSFAKIELRQQNELFCYDGDTCYVNVWYLSNPSPKQEKIRLFNLDTPEISKPKCEKEKELAEINILKQGETIILKLAGFSLITRCPILHQC